MLAYLDDVVLIGPPDKVMDAFKAFRMTASEIGLRVNPAKTTILTLATEPDVDSSNALDEFCISENLPMPTNCIMLLGSPVGLPALESNAAIDLVNAVPFRNLSMIPDKQVRLLLLRETISKASNHLARCMPPSTAKNALTLHDKSVLDIVLGVLELPRQEMSHVTKAEIALPLSRGGLGFHPLAESAAQYYLASVSAVIQRWRFFVPDSHPMLTSWCANISMTTDATSTGFSLPRELQAAVDSSCRIVTDSYGLKSLDPNPHFTFGSRAQPNAPLVVLSMPKCLSDLMTFRQFKRLQAHLARSKAILDINKRSEERRVGKECCG